MQNLLLDFLNVTESAAIAALPWIGSGDEVSADDAATTAMRDMLSQISMNGTIVIGEGEIDEAPMLFIGENLGISNGPDVDIAVDPIEGTTPTVKGQPNAITVIAAAPKGALLHAPDMYMEKITVGPKARGKINIDFSLYDNMKAVAKASGKKINELNIFVQDRPRHKSYIDTIRKAGAKVSLFNDGDVIYATATCMETMDADMFIGIGGAPEGVLAAVAVKCLGGEMQAKLIPRNDEEVKRCMEMGVLNPTRALKHDELINADECIFAATGITDNPFLNGIRTNQESLTTQSILVSGGEQKLRYIESKHTIQKNVS